MPGVVVFGTPGWLMPGLLVMPRPVVNDPQGVTVRQGLVALGFEEISEVRVGKYIVITLNEDSEERAREQVTEMCRKLLANHVIEDFRFDLLPVEQPVP